MGIHIEDVALRRSGSMYGYYGLDQVPAVTITPLGPPRTGTYVPKTANKPASEVQLMLKKLGFFGQEPTGYWGAVSGRAFDAWKSARGHSTFKATAANGHSVVSIFPAEAYMMLRKETGRGIETPREGQAAGPTITIPVSVPTGGGPAVAVRVPTTRAATRRVARTEPSEAAAPAPPAGKPWWAIGIGTLLSVAAVAI